MTSYSFGDVVLVPFPSTDHSGAKKRPAVVISSPMLHRETADLLIMAITTQRRAGSSLEAVVDDWQDAGLLRPSVVKPVFATIERGLVIRKLGTLTSPDLEALSQAIHAALGETS